MKRTSTLLFLFIMCIGNLNAQIIFEEDFEGGIVPAEWTIQTNASDGGWKVGTAAGLSTQAFGIQDNGSTRIAATNDDACNCNKSNEYFITPPIDLTNQSTVVLSFDAYFLDNTYQGNQEDATVEASTDGITWTVLEDLHGHGSWDKHSIDLSSYAGEDSLYIGFRYDDGTGWLYGFAIDNIVLEVPPSLDASLVDLKSRIFGEVATALPIKGVIYNEGINTISSLDISYSIDGGSPIVETIDGLNILSFTYYNFETATPWTPSAEGVYEIEVNITATNGMQDENQTNNTSDFETEIFAEVIVPNKIEDILANPPVISEIANSSDLLNKPTDLDFFPILGKDELWVINQRTEGVGGSTVTIADATAATPSDFLSRVDGNSWHFMSLPTAIAFSDDNFNFASSPGVQDANHDGGTFTGPSLWSSDPDIYAQPSGGNGSHLDMLHGSPFSMGIAHETDNVFWVYDDWNKDIVRYDFVDDHGPGNDDHSDATVRRYQNIGIDADGSIPNHMIIDKSSGWLYFVDNGNDRVMRLDINSGEVTSSLGLINEELAEHSAMGNFTTEVIIDSGVEQPCGIEIFENYLLVGDYATGDIIFYDMTNDFAELGRVATIEPGLTGVKVGPDGNIWYTNRIQNTLMSINAGEPLSTDQINDPLRVSFSPNPSSGKFWINISDVQDFSGVSINIFNATGQEILNQKEVRNNEAFDLSDFPEGVYFLHVQGEDFYSTKRIILNH